ncbi:Biotin biosynthesis cytochrome P450 [Mycolicibacterium vanbaalenii]|uniref:Biotin biosynthesis cytochrome P450 n=1 Tax=Mycolicibacterium vanbaalenii TaxID=110539 RepID=A0A5S9QZR3_MYCVN|nr:cytochrome P450 [Mycolicibacterium vanbaalenii]CAA0124501.1 Biotin biosynthesis cytochrome P450 [Mycolicibacterium vanbaalenii]
MTGYDGIDYFTDEGIRTDPYPFFDQLREKCPILPGAVPGVTVITGYQEALSTYKSQAMSCANSVVGPFAPLPFEPEGDDISEQLDEFRGQIPLADHITNMDAPQHTRSRGLLNRLITPKRLSENEEFMWRLADERLDLIVEEGKCEFVGDFAKPFTLLVIADLLGVPVEDHASLCASLKPGLVEGISDETMHNPLMWIESTFADYIQQRRQAPQNDVLSHLAAAKYPEGDTPPVDDVVKLATLVFAAGLETTVKLLSAAIRNLAEDKVLQERLRADRSLIPAFLEETLRLESPVKTHFRLARQSTEIGGCPIKAGTTLMLLPGASNRDERKFEDPNTFKLDRPNVREHLAFGRGAHSCPGAPLARAEAKIALNRILDRMADISIDDAHHGPADTREYSYEVPFVLRGLAELYITYVPVDAPANNRRPAKSQASA